jgi:hypothetical protein
MPPKQLLKKAIGHEIEAKKAKAKAKRDRKKARKALAQATFATTSGSGDYRPTRFNRVRGNGDYFSDLLGGIGKGAGGILDLGKGIFSKITGFGDYRHAGPRSNSLYRAPSSPSEAPFQMGAMSVKFDGGAPRVQHREFITNIVSPGAGFDTKSYRIQPGLKGGNVLFPWLSSVATCFQQYKMHGCIFEYVSTSSDFASNSGLGEVSLSTLYDANAQPLADILAINNNEFTTVDKPSQSFYHPLECAKEDSPVAVRYVRTDNSVATSDSDDRLDDIGLFQVTTVGLAAEAGTVIGQLWVTYDIELLKANLPDLHEGTSYVSTFVGSTDVSTTMDFSASTPNVRNSLPITVKDSQTIIMPKGYNGNYLLTVVAAGSDKGNGLYNWQPNVLTFGKDITPINIFPSAAGDYTTNALMSGTVPPPAFTNVISFSCAFSTIAENAVDDDNAISISFGGAATAGFSVYWTLLVVPLDNDIGPPMMSLNKKFTEDQLRVMVDKYLEERLRTLGQENWNLLPPVNSRASTGRELFSPFAQPTIKVTKS